MMFLQLLYLMVPAYVANMAPVFARKIPWNAPMDFGLSLNGVRLLGSHKTWRGFIAGSVAGTLAGVLVSLIYWPFAFSAVTWSVCASVGALLGDAVKSFFKRRLKIRSGLPWVPFDQIDYSIGALALGSLVFFPGAKAALIIIVVSMFAHVVVNHVAFFWGIREEKW